MLLLFLSLVVSAVALDTSSLPQPTTSPTDGGPECLCYPCQWTDGVFNIHPQKGFCDSRAVFIGKILKKEFMSRPENIWSPEYLMRYAPPSHWKYTLKVAYVYKDDTESVKVGSEVILRAIAQPGCEACDNMVERHLEDAGPQYGFNNVTTVEGDKYVFFVRDIVDFEGVIEMSIKPCDPIWRYIKDTTAYGFIPNHKLRMLQKTKCDKCVVSGCLQKRCTKPQQVSGCAMQPHEVRRLFTPEGWKSCYITQGACYQDTPSGQCVWKRSKAIEKCHEKYPNRSQKDNERGLYV